MEIRLLQPQEILPALHLVWEVFAQDVAPLYTPEGVGEFQKFIRYDSVIDLYQRKEMTLFGAYNGYEICGVSAVMADGHISLLYVRKQNQRQRIGSRLLYHTYQYCAQVLRVTTITVHAAPNAVRFYNNMGMLQVGSEQGSRGIRYVPMAMQVTPELAKSPYSSTSPIVITIAAGVVTFLLILLPLIVSAYYIHRMMEEISIYNRPYELYEEWEEINPDYEYFPEYYGDFSETEDYVEGERDQNGMDAVPAYQLEDLSYEIEDQTYSYTDEEKKTTLITFQVGYPEISGLKDSDLQNKVNEILKGKAMETVDAIYMHPSEEMKERVLEAQTPILADLVEYKVTYASEELLCVMYSDYSFQGGSDDYHESMRACTINLKNGDNYEIEDLVHLDQDFMGNWLDKMRREAGDTAFLSGIDEQELIQSLKGEGMAGDYVAEFFLDADGVAIGLSLNAREESFEEQDFVWVAAHYTDQEIQAYAAGKEFWNYME